MIQVRDEFQEKNKRDAQVTDNSFTQAVKNAGSGASAGEMNAIQGAKSDDKQDVSLKAYDELMRAKEARNDSSVEGERFRRDA